MLRNAIIALAATIGIAAATDRCHGRVLGSGRPAVNGPAGRLRSASLLQTRRPVVFHSVTQRASSSFSGLSSLKSKLIAGRESSKSGNGDLRHLRVMTLRSA